MNSGVLAVGASLQRVCCCQFLISPTLELQHDGDVRSLSFSPFGEGRDFADYGECVSRHGLVEQGCLQNQLTLVPHRSAAFSTRRMRVGLSQGSHRESAAKILQRGRFDGHHDRLQVAENEGSCAQPVRSVRRCGVSSVLVPLRTRSRSALTGSMLPTMFGCVTWQRVSSEDRRTPVRGQAVKQSAEMRCALEFFATAQSYVCFHLRASAERGSLFPCSLR